MPRPRKVDNDDSPEGQKLRHQKPETGPLEHRVIAILGISSAVMLGISLSILNAEVGPLANLKVLLVTVSAGIVAYSVNRFTIERGTALAAIGFHTAGVASIVAILVVGGGMFIGAYSGLVHKAVDERSLHENGSSLIVYVGDMNKVSLEIARSRPALQIIADDMTQYAACERRSSCISGNGNGGFGPVAAEVQKVAFRAAAIASAFDGGEVDQKSLLSDMNRLNSRYQQKLGQTEVDIGKRRIALQSIHAEIEQGAVALSEALPLALLQTFVNELNQGSVIPGQRRSTNRLNAILNQHGSALAKTVETVDGVSTKPPRFPQRPGMLDSLRYTGQFLAFAAVIFVAELVPPLTLWILTFLRLSWEIERRSPTRPPKEKSDGFDGLLDLDFIPATKVMRTNSSSAPKTVRPNGDAS